MRPATFAGLGKLAICVRCLLAAGAPMGTRLAFAGWMPKLPSIVPALLVAALALPSLGACYDTPPIIHFDDRGMGRWMPMPGVPDMAYNDVWGTGEHDLFAVGEGGLVHRGAAGWQPALEIAPANLACVWGRSSSQVWAGGENIVVTRTDQRWIEQELWDREVHVENYQVRSIFGDALHEYLLATVGGRQLVFENRGSHWEALHLTGLSPLPNEPTGIATGDGIIVAGLGEIALLQYHDFQWEAIRWSSWSSENNAPLAVAALAETDIGWIAAGSALQWHSRTESDLGSVERATALQVGAVHDVAAAHANKFFVVGKPTTLRGPDAISQLTTSAILACDMSQCSLEAVSGVPNDSVIEAVWADDTGLAHAVGRGFILQRSLAHGVD